MFDFLPMKSKMLHESELINIEEEMVLGPDHMLRRFTLNNRVNGLSVAINTIGAKISSIRLDSRKDEIVVDSIPLDSIAQRFEWNSHVVGLDSLMLTTNSSSSQCVIYQLTKDNELIINGKFKGQQHQTLFHPFYINLNSVTTGASVDGHVIQIKPALENDLVQPLTITGDTSPFNIGDGEPCKLNWPDDMDRGTIDVIVSCITDIFVTLEYGSKKVEVNLSYKSNNAPVLSCCRLRVRICKRGISVMPFHMNEFRCTYKLVW